jgi:hypothetical protein
MTVDSGNGIQALWRLSEAVEPKSFAKVERLSLAVTLTLGGDAGTQDVSRILRLPGTTNLPNAKKRKAGRVACKAKLLHFSDATYPLSAFDFLDTRQQDLAPADPQVALQEVISNGCYEHWGQDRSRAVWFVACECVRRGWTDEQILEALLDRSNKISEHIYDQGAPPQYAARQVAKAREREGPGGVTINDFVAYMPQHLYIFMPTGEMWPAASVDACVPPVDVGGERTMRAGAWLDAHAAVQQMTWAPGHSNLVQDKLISDGGWIDRPGCTVFNLYRPPTIIPREGDVTRWLDHGRKLYGEDAEHIFRYLAHRVQRPHEKINHALVLGGLQGVGKDTLLHPVKQAVGPWNFFEVNPQQVIGRFNGFLKAVILRVSEARDLGDSDRFAFYDHMKAYTATPPDVLRIDEKYLREYYIFNLAGIIITTNHKTDGIYLPADDRRHFVVWSDLTKEAFSDNYWRELWGWYDSGGVELVAHYLSNLDLSSFDAKAPPPKTQAFWEIVNTSRAPEDAQLMDALDRLEWPDAVTKEIVASVASPDFSYWLHEPRNARRIPHRFEDCGYVVVQNPDAQKGLWRIQGRRQAVYAKRELLITERLAAASKLDRPEVI